MYIQQHRKKQSRYFWKNYPIYQADILAASQKKKKKQIPSLVYIMANSNQIISSTWECLINEILLGFINLPAFFTSHFWQVTILFGNHLYLLYNADLIIIEDWNFFLLQVFSKTFHKPYRTFTYKLYIFTYYTACCEDLFF